ncbi:uncharacterized protein LOC127248569 [Andrographis paniculata]|uniref:uncharacterized protein LOC127248569 n=1 Tax=Andrographis paniculata TaxID=175694 RepID=UPI0021E83AFD|nr:uncharacterized protein LOC127248569 [Andrographis paniculata]
MMLNSYRLRISNPGWAHCYSTNAAASSPAPSHIVCPGRSNRRRFAPLAVQARDNAYSDPLPSSQLSSTVGSSAAFQPSNWTFTHRHVQFLTYIACAAAISATWLFCSAIPTLLAFKRAAESMEKLIDATREELPSTMAAIRLSGMEISDLTMELSDLGQEITQGVRSSTRAVRLAEERLRGLTAVNPIASTQEVMQTKPQIAEPILARTARGMREGIVKGRAALQIFFTLSRYSKILLNFFTSRAKS